jgi:hypothetical protein
MEVFNERSFDPNLSQDDIESMSTALARDAALGRDLAGLLRTDEDHRVFMAAFSVWMAHLISNRLGTLALDLRERNFRERYPFASAEDAAYLNRGRR